MWLKQSPKKKGKEKERRRRRVANTEAKDRKTPKFPHKVKWNKGSEREEGEREPRITACAHTRQPEEESNNPDQHDQTKRDKAGQARDRC
jgi:hypothetical protein